MLGDWYLRQSNQTHPEGHLRGETFHRSATTAAVFDDPNLVSAAGWSRCSLWPTLPALHAWPMSTSAVPGDKGANAGLKVASLVAATVAGADSIKDMALLRHGGMGRVFQRAYAASTLASFLRAFAFGHVRQLDAVARRFLAILAAKPHRSLATAQVGGCWSMSTTRSSRFTSTPGRAPGSTTAGCAAYALVATLTGADLAKMPSVSRTADLARCVTPRTLDGLGGDLVHAALALPLLILVLSGYKPAGVTPLGPGADGIVRFATADIHRGLRILGWAHSGIVTRRPKGRMARRARRAIQSVAEVGQRRTPHAAGSVASAGRLALSSLAPSRLRL